MPARHLLYPRKQRRPGNYCLAQLTPPLPYHSATLARTTVSDLQDHCIPHIHSRPWFQSSRVDLPLHSLTRTFAHYHWKSVNLIINSGPDPLATTSERLSSLCIDVGHLDDSRQSVVVPTPYEVPDNYYTSVTNPADNVVQRVAALQQACRYANYNALSSVGRVQGVLWDLFKNPSSDEAAVAHLNTDPNEAVDKRHEAEVLLAIRGIYLSQSSSEFTRLIGELKKAVDGLQSAETSLASRDLDLAKDEKLRDSSILILGRKCVNSTEPAHSFAGVNTSLGLFRHKFAEFYEKVAILQLYLDS